MRRFILVTAAVISMGCQHEPKPGEKIADVCKPDNDGKEVSVSGYLATSGFMLCSDTCQLEIHEKKTEEEPAITVNVAVGDGEGQMKKLPEEFKATDIEVKAHGGGTASYLDVIRVTGKAIVSGDSCQVSDIAKIEKL